MFDRIAGRYDLLNRVISFGFDRRWRKEVVKHLPSGERQLILDLGTGTGDLAFAAAKTNRGEQQIIGLDASLEMLKRARAKQQANSYKIRFVQGSALRAPFKGEIFDAAITAFMLRNVSDLPCFLADAFRLLKPGGKVVCLDMFPPGKSWFSPLYAIYFYNLVPSIGALLARDRGAYRYLAESVKHFLTPERVLDLIKEAGFRPVVMRKFLKGAVCIHVGEKPVE
jgi:demethylmenaquinone methyltransferase / 2-methoxy-6-polyprenyl-1,4-benzoquinol methylase